MTALEQQATEAIETVEAMVAAVLLNDIPSLAVSLAELAHDPDLALQALNMAVHQIAASHRNVTATSSAPVVHQPQALPSPRLNHPASLGLVGSSREPRGGALLTVVPS